MDAIQKHPERITNPEAPQIALAKASSGWRFILSLIGRRPLDTPAKEAMQAMQADFEKLKEMKGELIVQSKT
jgi:hypothetical protein